VSARVGRFREHLYCNCPKLKISSPSLLITRIAFLRFTSWLLILFLYLQCPTECERNFSSTKKLLALMRSCLREDIIEVTENLTVCLEVSVKRRQKTASFPPHPKHVSLAALNSFFLAPSLDGFEATGYGIGYFALRDVYSALALGLIGNSANVASPKISKSRRVP
jgi:hypothetical protein